MESFDERRYPLRIYHTGAFAARDMGIKATICISEGAPISKIEATRSYGANVVLVPGVYDDAYAEAVRLRDEQGLTFIHPFNDYSILAAQGKYRPSDPWK